MISKAKIFEIKELHHKKGREERNSFIIEGWKILEEALNAHAEIELVVVDETRIDSDEKKKIFAKLKKQAEIFFASEKELSALSDAVTSQGIIAVVEKLHFEKVLQNVLEAESGLIVAVEAMNDPGNLGTIIRTCDWFGVDALVIGKNSVEMYNPKVVRATMGSLFHFPILCDIDLRNFLSQSCNNGFSIYSTELSNSEDVRKISFSRKSVIVIGSESHGISKEISTLADKKIFIPKFGSAESLNAAMACGVILSYIKLK